MRRARGFSLLELLVVVFIVGLIATFSVVSITDRAQDDRLEQEARRLLALLQLAQETAVLQGSEIGFVSDGRSYEFLELDEAAGWKAPPDDTPLRPRELPAGMQLEVRVDDFALPIADQSDPDEDKAGKPPVVPDVFFLSSEEVSPFELILSASGSELIVRVVATAEGEIRIAGDEEARPPRPGDGT